MAQQKRLVKNAKNWIDMDGETMLEKRLNSIITVAFIGYLDVPADESLEHARNIIALVNKQDGDVELYLEEVFYMKPSDQLMDNIQKAFDKWFRVKQSSLVFN